MERAQIHTFEVIDGKGVHYTISECPYHGKTVRGIAACENAENYDPDFGVTLSQAKCVEKVLYKRLRFATLRKDEIEKKRITLEENYQRELKKLLRASEVNSERIKTLTNDLETVTMRIAEMINTKYYE